MRLAIDPPRRAVSHGYPRPYMMSHLAMQVVAAEISPFDRIMLARKHWIRPVTDLLKSALKIQVVSENASQRYQFLKDLPLSDEVKTLYLVGYWQTHRIVDEVADELREEFRFRDSPQGKNLEILRQIERSENPVSLHMRRGDFTLAAEGNIALPLDYYERAISTMRERLGNPTFFVFSDDIAYAREHLKLGKDAFFVSHNDVASSHEDLRLMSSCRHHIIANSTFSWWGAWLNASPDKMVFAPKHWLLKPESHYPDLLPDQWLLEPTSRQE